MDFRAKDFERMMINVYEVPEHEDLFRRFPILDTYETFKQQIGTPVPDAKGKIQYVETSYLNNQLVMRYIIYTFDQNSPLLTVPDMVERRVNAAFLAGFRHDGTNKFPEPIEKMIRSENAIINMMVIQYCILQMSDDYLSMVAYQDTLRRSSLNLLNDDSTEKTSELIKTMENCRSHIAEIRGQLLTTTKDHILTKSLYIFKEATKLRLRPEDMAKQLMEHDSFIRSITA